jgi:hypothetical protein
MLACMTEVSTAYHVPVTAIERVVTAAKGQGGIGPMGIPKRWLPVLGVYGFSVATLRKSPCWGIAAGTWVLAVERLYAHPLQGAAHNGVVYPTHIGAIPQQDVRWAHQAALQTHVPASLILAVAAQESGFNPGAVSPKGAQGLMQFMPGTWARYGQGSPFNPKAAIFAGAAYLRHLALKLGNWPLAIAGYNAGGQAVINAGYHIPPYRQTQNYVPEVLARYQRIVGIGDKR